MTELQSVLMDLMRVSILIKSKVAADARFALKETTLNSRIDFSKDRAMDISYVSHH